MFVCVLGFSPSHLCVVKNYHAPDGAAISSLKSQLFPKSCCFRESELLKRSFCKQFDLLCVRMRIFCFRKSWDQEEGDW